MYKKLFVVLVIISFLGCNPISTQTNTEASKNYLDLLQQSANQMLIYGRKPSFIISQEQPLKWRQAILTIQNDSNNEISSFVAYAIVRNRKIPFVAMVSKKLEKPLIPHTSRTITVELDSRLGWSKHLSGKDKIKSAEWVIFSVNYPNGSIAINEDLGLEVGNFYTLRKQYETLRAGKKN